MFIVLEGVDGAGTSTLQRGLQTKFEECGLMIHCTHQPNEYTHAGGLIRDLLRYESLSSPLVMSLLFAADRLELNLSQYSDMDLVLCDRHVWSSLVYQHEVDQSWLKEINRYADAPDLVVYVRTSPGVAKDRMGMRELDAFEKDSKFQEGLTRRFDRVFNESKGPKVLVDGDQPAEDVLDSAWTAIWSYLPADMKDKVAL